MPKPYMPVPEPDDDPNAPGRAPLPPPLDAEGPSADVPLTAEEIAQLTRIAIYPEEGEVFAFGSRPLARQYVGIDTEQAITNRVLALAATYPGGTLAEVFEAAQGEVVDLAAWILADYDAEGEDLDTGRADAWIRDRRNKVTTRQCISLVLGQLELHEQVILLGKALSASVQFEILAAAFNLPTHRPTSATTP